MKHLVLVLMLSFSCSVAFAQGGSEFSRKKSKKLGLEVQIQDSNKTLEGLIKTKNLTKDPDQRLKLVEEMKKVHSDNQKAIQSYNKLVKELKYRFPEKGDHSERKYLPMRSRSLEQIEREMGLDAVLSEAKDRVDRKYAPIVEESKRKERERKKAKNFPEEIEAPKKKKKKNERLRLVR